MFLIRKASQNLLKNKGRNIVILIMLSIVILASTVGLTLFNVRQTIYAETRNYFAGEVSIAPCSGTTAGGAPSLEDYKNFVSSEYLRSYAFYKCLPITIKGLKLLDGEYGSSSSEMSNARAYGLLDGKSMGDYNYGERVITLGHFPSNKTECMLSSDLAEYNNLTLGDTVTFIIGRMQIEKTITISGIYSDSTVERRQANHRSPMLNARNDIITSYDFFDEFNDSLDTASSFFLKDDDDLNAFQEELYSKGLSTSYILEFNTVRYNQTIAEISAMSGLVTLFFVIIAIIGIAIVFFVNLFALRERKYEIGVLRAIGMPKTKVAFLLISEMMILAMSGIFFAVIAGIFINPLVVDYMMHLEMNHELPSVLKTAASNINSSFSLVVLLELLTSTAALVLLAGSATISSIMRFDPMQILVERN